jgi:hypothetical protein
VFVRLTDRGRELYEEMHPAFQARVNELLGCLTAEEKTQLTALLRRLLEHLRDLQPACGDAGAGDCGADCRPRDAT